MIFLLTLTYNRSDAQVQNFVRTGKKIDNAVSIIFNNVHRENDDLRTDIRSLKVAQRRLAKEQSRQKSQDQKIQMAARQQLIDRFITEHGKHVDCIAETIAVERASQKRTKQKDFQIKVLDSLYFEKIDDRQLMIDEKY